MRPRWTLMGFVSSHGTRIAQLNEWMGEAWPYYQNPNLPLPGRR